MESDYKLYHGDCLKMIDQLPDRSVDLMLTDPPYNISRENRFWSMNRQSIDFGAWDHDFDQTGWIAPAVQKIAKNGAVIIFNRWHNLGMIADELERNGMDVKDCIRWEKTNPMPRNRDRRYVADFEAAVWAVKRGGDGRSIGKIPSISGRNFSRRRPTASIAFTRHKSRSVCWKN